MLSETDQTELTLAAPQNFICFDQLFPMAND